MKKGHKDGEQIDKKCENSVAPNDSTILDKTTVETDAPIKEDCNNIINNFVTELPHRTKLLDDDRKLVVKNEASRVY